MDFIGARKIGGGKKYSSARVPQAAISTPRMPPATASVTLSTTSILIIAPRVAPSAVRTEISRVRTVARASRRFDTLAQAINKTSNTAPSSR